MHLLGNLSLLAIAIAALCAISASATPGINFEAVPASVFKAALELASRKATLRDRCLKFAIQIMQKKKEYKQVYDQFDIQTTPNLTREAHNLFVLLARRFKGVNWAEMDDKLAGQLRRLFEKCTPALKAELRPEDVGKSIIR